MFPSPKARILLVEDEAIVARDIRLQLQSLGYEVVGLAARGEEAIALTAQHRPDLVLMDIELAGSMDGITAAQHLRADRQHPVPIVFLTAFDAEATLARAKLAEPFGYLLKPFSPRDLRTLLEMALYKFHAEALLRESREYSQTLLDHMLDGVVAFDASGTIASCNPAALRIFGHQPPALAALVPAYMQSQLQTFLQQVCSQEPGATASLECELTGQRHDASVFPMSLSVSCVANSVPPAFMALVRDLSDAQQTAEEIHHLAYYDRLTELPNRRLFIDHLQQALLASARSAQHGAVILLDLDHFKQVNDTLGHETGDQLLREVARRLKATVRETDQVARLGGDEFVIVLGGLSTQAQMAANQAETAARKFLMALCNPFTLARQLLHVTPSLGIVVFLAQSQSQHELIQNAEIAMYQAKEAGRTTFRFFDPAMQAAVSHRADCITDLQKALEQQDFELHYQLQFNRENQAIGAEALVRWRHALRGMVSPAEFIALAEETQMILPLGKWVLDNACAELARWQQTRERAHWTLAVNVSALQFAQANFVATVLEALDTSGANPHGLKLELTESMLVKDLHKVVEKMQTLKARGVTFSLDDFGTGYSSLSYLKRLPLDQLKIDQSFVRDLLSDTNDAAIANAIVALGHSLGLQVVAEGVETLAQRDALAGIACDAFQGYYFARPVSATELPLQ